MTCPFLADIQLSDQQLDYCQKVHNRRIQALLHKSLNKVKRLKYSNSDENFQAHLSK